MLVGGSVPWKSGTFACTWLNDFVVFPPGKIFKADGQKNLRRGEIEVQPGIVRLEIDIGKQAGGIQLFRSAANVLLRDRSSEMNPATCSSSSLVASLYPANVIVFG